MIYEENPEALFLDGFDKALLGKAKQGLTTLACYDYESIIDILMNVITAVI